VLGLPLSVVGEVSATIPWRLVGHSSDGVASESPLVVDLSSLWAGPLCASLLRLLGCRVVKVEDPRRPDGARRGPTALFDLLNAGAESEVVDLAGDRGRERLRELVLAADVVIEGSRPRALRQLGIEAEEVVAQSERLTWVSITGYGREHERVGFGDDTAVAGGLVADGCFVGDAIADPLTGVHAALAGWAGVCRGGGWLVDVPLARVAATAAGLGSPSAAASRRDGAWWVETAGGPVRVRDPRVRQAPGPGPALP
jgi:crotonobetainyl-CoA:carnitine CoA-transferase CaiB-like acyl-CoA transferase